VYKDQLMVFGGMKNLNEVLDDLMVLHLKDDEDQSRAMLSDTRKICPTCHLVFGLKDWQDQLQADHVN
jgi:hypothetical protein